MSVEHESFHRIIIDFHNEFGPSVALEELAVAMMAIYAFATVPPRPPLTLRSERKGLELTIRDPGPEEAAK